MAVLLLLVTGFGLLATATPANAAPGMSAFQSGVLREAARHRGAPYVYGAAGPSRFDCSGFTMYVFRRFGIRLPHNAAAQYARVHHIRKSSLRVGDLIFFNSGRNIYHVGIYAGSGRIWHAPHTGARVSLTRIWTSHYLVGRV